MSCGDGGCCRAGRVPRTHDDERILVSDGYMVTEEHALIHREPVRKTGLLAIRFEKTSWISMKYPVFSPMMSSLTICKKKTANFSPLLPKFIFNGISSGQTGRHRLTLRHKGRGVISSIKRKRLYSPQFLLPLVLRCVLPVGRKNRFFRPVRKNIYERSCLCEP